MIFPLTKFYKLVIFSLLFVTNNCSNIPKDILYETDGAQLIKAGNSLIINGKYKEAAEYYQRALTIDMTDSEAFGNLSVAFYYLGKYDDAIREAIQAIILSPEEINWRLNLGASYSRKGNYKGAIDAYENAVVIARKIRNNNKYQLRNALIGLGRSSELAGLFHKSLEAYQEALNFSPEDSELLTGMGNIYFRQDQLDEAEKLYKRAIAKDSTHAVAKYNMALVFAKTGRHQEAIKLFASNPTISERFRNDLNESSVNTVERSKTSSIKDFRANIGKMGGPSSPSRTAKNQSNSYIFIKGLSYYQQGSHTAALEAFRQALLENPVLPEAYLYIGNILAQQDQYKAAINAYENAVKLDTSFVEAYNNLGSMYANTSRVKEAMNAYQKAISLDRKFYDARTNLGLLYSESGELEKAADQFYQVIRAEVEIPEAHNNLGMVYSKQGMYNEAQKQFRKAILLRSDFPEAYNNLALSYSRNTAIDDIIEMLRKLAAKWAGHDLTEKMAYDWLPLRRVPLQSSQVGGAARKAYRMGVNAAFTNSLKDALQYFRAALENRPEWAAARLAEGTVLLAQNNWDESIKVLEGISSLYLKDPLPNTIMTIAKLSSGDYNSALDTWQKVVEFSMAPEKQEIEEAWQKMQIRSVAADQAVEALEKAIILEPRFATAHFNLGLVNDQLHRYDKAIDCFEKFVKLAPTKAIGYFHLGIAHYRLGRDKKAQTAITEYIKLSKKPILIPQVETFLNRSRTLR
mgnify:CR=1 FL=1